MRLIGMLDSPYVRRVAISLDCLGIAFEHAALSVFKNFAEFQQINAVVKAPTLVCDDGTVLMDSSLILQFIEASATNGKSLWAADAAGLLQEFRAVSLALAACDKGVQIIYERNLRPASAQYEPWLDRATAQLLAACAGLEQEVTGRPQAFANVHSQATITAAVTWQFIQQLLPGVVLPARHPALAALSAVLENTSPFRKYPPLGSGVSALPGSE